MLTSRVKVLTSLFEAVTMMDESTSSTRESVLNAAHELAGQLSPVQVIGARDNMNDVARTCFNEKHCKAFCDRLFISLEWTTIQMMRLAVNRRTLKGALCLDETEVNITAFARLITVEPMLVEAIQGTLREIDMWLGDVRYDESCSTRGGLSEGTASWLFKPDVDPIECVFQSLPDALPVNEALHLTAQR
jgi:hypothetical protein